MYRVSILSLRFYKLKSLNLIYWPFTKTWLNHSIYSEDLFLESYQSPERKAKEGDNHGGVIIYVKEGIYYKRRRDLEIHGLEAIWTEVANTHKHILFGLFYRPPNSNATYYTMIEDFLSCC